MLNLGFQLFIHKRLHVLDISKVHRKSEVRQLERLALGIMRALSLWRENKLYMHSPHCLATHIYTVGNQKLDFSVSSMFY